MLLATMDALSIKVGMLDTWMISVDESHGKRQLQDLLLTLSLKHLS